MVLVLEAAAVAAAMAAAVAVLEDTSVTPVAPSNHQLQCSEPASTVSVTSLTRDLF